VATLLWRQRHAQHPRPETPIRAGSPKRLCFVERYRNTGRRSWRIWEQGEANCPPSCLTSSRHIFAVAFQFTAFPITTLLWRQRHAQHPRPDALIRAGSPKPPRFSERYRNTGQHSWPTVEKCIMGQSILELPPGRYRVLANYNRVSGGQWAYSKSGFPLQLTLTTVTRLVESSISQRMR